MTLLLHISTEVEDDSAEPEAHDDDDGVVSCRAVTISRRDPFLLFLRPPSEWVNNARGNDLIGHLLDGN